MFSSRNSLIHSLVHSSSSYTYSKETEQKNELDEGGTETETKEENDDVVVDDDDDDEKE